MHECDAADPGDPPSHRGGDRPTVALRGAALAVAVLASAPAAAHFSGAGTSDFYNGAAHPFVVPAHVLILVALGLLLGQRLSGEGSETRTVDSALGLFAVALAAGMGAAYLIAPGGLPAVSMLAAAAVAGLLVASAPRGPRWLPHPVAALAGVLIGLDSAPDSAPLTTGIGTLLGAFLGLFYVMWASSFARREWLRIGLRILGSWVAAIAVLLLSLLAAGR